MTGGRRPIEYDEWEERRPAPPALSAEQVRLAATLSRYQRAATFRRRANNALRPLKISFAQWRVLEATWRLVRQTHDAVSHLDVSRDLELDEASVSRLMHVLSRRDLVSHGPDCRFYAWRVFMTQQGEELVETACGVVAAIAKASGFCSASDG